MFRLGPDEPCPDLSMFPVQARGAEPVYHAGGQFSWMPTRCTFCPSRHCRRWGARAGILTSTCVGSGRPYLVDCPGSPHPELDWCGGGWTSARYLLAMIPTIRCVMPSLEQAGLAGDPVAPRTVAAHSRRCLGSTRPWPTGAHFE